MSGTMFRSMRDDEHMASKREAPENQTDKSKMDNTEFRGVKPQLIVSDDEDNVAPPKRTKNQESAIIGGFKHHSDQYGFQSNANIGGPLKAVNESHVTYVGTQFPGGGVRGGGGGKPPVDSTLVNLNDLNQWQSYLDSNQVDTIKEKHQRDMLQSMMSNPNQQQMYGSMRENSVPGGGVHNNYSNRLPPIQNQSMQPGNGPENIFSLLSPENHRGMGPSGTQFDFGHQGQNFGNPAMHEQGNMSTSGMFGALGGAGADANFGQPFQMASLPQGFLPAMQNNFGIPTYPNTFQPTYSHTPSLYEQYRKDQMSQGNNPQFYHNISPPQSPPKPLAHNIQINDAILKENFNRYSVGGHISPDKFLKLIEEIYTFNHLPVPSYHQCLMLMAEHDTSNDGLIDFGEFKVMMAKI